ncbi:hypothetical protein HJC23_000473 [Cyclotella cryptica]|uniref:AAA+ ATPase domain-containing protein n=1 Tax=Cyclotella cryptica TaxID=29204 RepID=A0ABD3Q9W4_9STRA|eukprot:CCRYP_007228-RA/>CCRYP_007228-RA protein AED:0.14 eAED:-0.12 QI:0/-1/0/1/-1/1/1/0/712
MTTTRTKRRARTSTCPRLCTSILLTTSCTFAAPLLLASASPRDDQRQSPRFIRRPEPSSSTSSTSTIRSPRKSNEDAAAVDENIHRESATAEKTGFSANKLLSPTGDAPIVDAPRATGNSIRVAESPSSRKPSITIDTKSLLALIQSAVLHSSKPLLRTVTFAAQLSVACYLAKASWNVVREAWDEIHQEYSTHYKRQDAADVREEQDLPFADSDALADGLLDNDDDRDDHDDTADTDNTDANFSSWKRYSPARCREKTMTPQMTAMRDLAVRLRSAGIPYASEVAATGEATGTVEQVIQSLTRAEGNVLSQTLLTPMDNGGMSYEGGDDDDDEASQDTPESTAAKAWNAIGGLAQAKESLLDLAFPLLPSQSLSPSSSTTTTTFPKNEYNNNYYGGLLANPPGVLLYGPPGCGKSMLVRALANTVGARFLVVSPSCLLRKYVGETNLNVRALFSAAAKISPCVIFVDELDGLFRERGGEDHDVSRDLKTEFLQLWDGIRHHHLQGGAVSSSSSSVLVIGATNRPFDVDPAFLRRMPRRIFIGLPDYDARVAVLTNMLRYVPLESSFDIELVARSTAGYSPSDIREVLQAAALYPLREARAAAMSLSSVQSGNEGDGRVPLSIPPLRKLRTDDVLRALQVAKPTQFSKKYERELMEYVRCSGGGGEGDNRLGGIQAPSDTDGITFSSEFFNSKGEDEESDDYSYDSESDDEL